ncbi:PAS domain S-box protein [candidate division WOR-3 bacterium]|nr:PAS domain S-box protein [candidate division WOR-3 bacterium]
MAKKKNKKVAGRPYARKKGRQQVRESYVAARKALADTKKIGGTPICERLAFLLSETSVVIYAARVRGDYGVTFISDNVRVLVGYSPRSFMARSSFWIDHVHPDDRQRVLREVRRVFEKGHFQYEYRFRHKKGHYLWLSDEMKLACDAKGKPVEIVGYWTDITRRRQLEEDIQKRSERIVEFMDSATEGFVLIDPGFNVIHVNRYLLDHFGVKLEDARNVNILDVVDDVWESGRYDKYMDVLRTGKPCLFEDIVAPLEYGDRHLNLVAFKVGDNIGVIVQDVTNEKRKEQQLRESEERLRSLYDSVHAGIVFCDSKGTIIRANKIACDILDVDEVTGSKLVELMGGLTDRRGTTIMKEDHPVLRVLERAQPVRNVVIGIGSKYLSGKRWLMASVEPVVDPLTRKLDEVLVTFIDFTEQKQIEDALVESEERYRHLFENSPVGIGISAPDGRIIAANKAMLEIIGYSLEECRSMNLADTYPVIEERELLLQALERDGCVNNYRIQLRRKDGTLYYAILYIARINIGGRTCFHTMCQVAT